jgi:hypothetical protein
MERNEKIFDALLADDLEAGFPSKLGGRVER